MIPLKLRVSGFLSYRDPVELNFDSFNLACISGHNGAGKSSLLDSITWALFGEARGKGNDVVNLHQDVKAAEVTLDFEYEGNAYRVHRGLPRGKTTVLEFQVLDRSLQNGSEGQWKALTEKTTKETQKRIEQTLRMDHETFINASFFLQGKADQFTQKKASDRKAVLGTVLGLEAWDEYKARASDLRKVLETEAAEIDGRISEIDAELGEADERNRQLGEIERTLKQLTAAREAHESALENIRKSAALIREQKKMAETLSNSMERSRAALNSLDARYAQKKTEGATHAQLIARQKEIEAAYKQWQKTRKELEEWEKTATEFREHESERAPLLAQIAAEKARLEEEQRGLLNEEMAAQEKSAALKTLDVEIEKAKVSLANAEKVLKERADLEITRNDWREKLAGMRAENEILKREMDEYKARIDSLQKADGAVCPVCGQELNEAHRKSTLKELETDGKKKGDKWRANKKESEDLEKQIAELESQISRSAGKETELNKISGAVSQLTERKELALAAVKEWELKGKKRLAELTKELEKESFATDARKQLAKLDKELSKLGYDASTHDEKRRDEIKQRGSEEEYRLLETAKGVAKQIESEVKNLEEERNKRKDELSEQEKAYQAAARELANSESQSPDADAAERKLIELREDENRARSQMGAARQKVDVLATLQTRRKDYAAQREEINQGILRYKALENAFGKNGVPALLIEQALPQIEQKANDLLERLSDSQMSIRFVTQAEYRDKKRDDLKETLDIQISDSAGTRNYEMYSGGEAFRVNFAIRLALSEILAQRKGARLQTLVIDEGFGSQDALGRQRLIEAINAVKNDFEKILIITHLDELKDAFPNRIEVEKTERGSTVRVM